MLFGQHPNIQINMEQTKHRISIVDVLVILTFILLLLLVGSYTYYNQTDPKLATPNHDTIYKAETIDNNTIELTLKHNKYLARINDSLMARKPIYVIRYKTKFDSLYITDTSCQSSLIMLYNSFGDLNDLNDSIIANSSKRLVNDSILIATLNHKIGLKQSRVTIDSTRLVALIDTLPKVKRRGYFKGLRHGAVIGAALVGTALIIK